MKVYLVQHAKALPEEIDPDRALSKEGHDDAERMAGWAASVGLEVQQIRHSGKTRAAQTANTLAEGLTAPDGVVEFAGLGPVDDVKPIAAELTIAQQPLMLALASSQEPSCSLRILMRRISDSTGESKEN